MRLTFCLALAGLKLEEDFKNKNGLVVTGQRGLYDVWVARLDFFNSILSIYLVSVWHMY